MAISALLSGPIARATFVSLAIRVGGIVLVALPATTGLKQADLKQLERLIGPIAKTWLESKLQALETLFEDHISGAVTDALQQTLDSADRLLTDIDAEIDGCGRAMAKI